MQPSDYPPSSCREAKARPGNTDPLSRCLLDHAPQGTSRQAYINLRYTLSQWLGRGEAVDIGAVVENDEHIAAIAKACAEIRASNRPQ